MGHARATWIAGGLAWLSLLLATILPLWSGQGERIYGWEPGFFDWGRWFVLAGALWTSICIFIKALATSSWKWFGGALVLLEAGLVLWRGYHLHAIGSGAWFLLASGLLFLAASGLLSYRQA